MDSAVATKMAVGDRVTGNTYFDKNLITVTAINVDGNANKFTFSGDATGVADGITLSFSS